jgi:2-polyprenyl-3-methyl-5-hydroxy-6-metoxy-1,4-benzoquinol methylase
MNPTIKMVKIGSIDDLCADDLWNEIRDLQKALVPQIAEMANSNLGLTACPICNQHDISVAVHKDGFRIDQCGSCSFRFTNPAPSEKQLEFFYNSKIKQLENIAFEGTRASRLPIFERRLSLIQQYLAGGKLLDIGGSNGIFIDAIIGARAPFEVTVVDLNRDSVAKLRQKYPTVQAIHGDALKHDGSYDVITLWDTIEHLPDVNRVASHLFSLLRPGGFLFLSTPNVHSFEHSVGQYRHPQILPLSHVNYFAPPNLTRLLERHHFRVVDCLTPNGSFDIAYINRMISDGDADLGQLGGFLKQHLQSSAFADDFAALISKHRLAGNLLMIAERPAVSHA